MKRTIITIDEAKCNGCGLCIPNCPEGALQMINGKARLVGDLLCDGLGACIGHCPEGAIILEEREAQPYSEKMALENIIPQGIDVVRAHLMHLRNHNQAAYYEEALTILSARGIDAGSLDAETQPTPGGGCPGAASRVLNVRDKRGVPTTPTPGASELTHWPVQLHLLSPMAPQYQGADLLLCADCVPYAYPDFHSRLLSGKALAIACPKLDAGQDIYVEKLRVLIDEARINSLTVAIMEVPCCRGLLALAQQAVAAASRQIAIKQVVIGIEGEILNAESGIT